MRAGEVASAELELSKKPVTHQDLVDFFGQG